MHSIRFKAFAFITAVLLTLLLLLNIYPIMSSRELVFEEKRSAMSSQASLISSSLAALDRLEPKSVGEIIRLLDIQGYSRLIVVDSEGTVLYDDGGETGGRTDIEDLLTALGGKTAYRSRFADAMFLRVFFYDVFLYLHGTSYHGLQ